MQSQSQSELVLFGPSRSWSRCKDVKAKTCFFLLFSLFLYEKEPEPVKKKARMDYRWENLLQALLNKFAVISINRDSVITDLAYLIAGSITQSRLVHCMLQEVEHTDPTEWSNSHLLHWRQIVLTVRQTVSLFKGCSLFFFNDYFVINFADGSATFYTVECTGFVPK